MTEHIIADSGKRESFATGAVRDARSGKGRFDLISPVLLRRLALILEKGAIKYAARNWEQGMPLSRFLDSAKRHLNDAEMIALYQREGRPLTELPADINPNEDHWGQAVWNLHCLIHTQEMRPDLDDLSKPAGRTKSPDALKRD